MTEPYGPGDTSIPEWTSPTGAGVPAPPPMPPGAMPPPPMPGQMPPGPGQRANYAAPAGTPTYRSWQPGIMPLRPLTFGDFLALPFKAMRYNRTVVIGGPLAFTLLASLAAGIAIWMMAVDPAFGLFSTTPATVGTDLPRGDTWLALLVAGLLSILADVLARAIVAPGVSRAILGERITLSTAWGMVRPRLWRVIGLYGTAMAVSAILLGVFFTLIALSAINNSTGALAIVLIIGIPLMIAGVFLYEVGMGVAVPLIVLERGGVFASIRRTARLLRGRFWWTVLIAFVAGLLVNVAASTLQFAAQIVGSIALFASPGNSGAVIFAVSYGVGILISSLLTYAYIGSTFAFVYVDLRIRHEGFDADLAEAAEARARR